MTTHLPAAVRSQDLVFTLYGDYLLDRPNGVWVGSLITLLGELDLSPMAVRVVLSRMARKGWLTVERRGPRSYYGLTRRGRTLLEQGRERIYHPPHDEAWDGTWRLVTYSVPEQRRRLRDLLRVKLQWLGCGALSNGVWLSPHDIRADVAEIARSLRLTKHVELFEAQHTGFSSTAALVAQCWDLRGVNARYARFIARWQEAAPHCEQCALTQRGAAGRRRATPSCAAPAACFVRRFRIVHEYRAFPLEDPYLPAALLPDDWHGGEAARLFAHYHELLAEPATRYVREVCDAGDERDASTPLAEAAAV